MTKEIGKYTLIREFIAAQGSSFVTVDFIKKDGTLRSINFNPRGAKKHVKGKAAKPSSIQAAKTRAANNPHLLNVFEHNNVDDTTKFRSINMDTIRRISANKRELVF